MTLSTERGTLSVEEAATYLGISRSKTWELVSRGELPSFHIGRTRRLSLERLQAWIREQEAAEPSAA
jgi:excisionase family DNA binding protein